VHRPAANSDPLRFSTWGRPKSCISAKNTNHNLSSGHQLDWMEGERAVLKKIVQVKRACVQTAALCRAAEVVPATPVLMPSDH